MDANEHVETDAATCIFIDAALGRVLTIDLAHELQCTDGVILPGSFFRLVRVGREDMYFLGLAGGGYLRGTGAGLRVVRTDIAEDATAFIVNVAQYVDNAGDEAALTVTLRTATGLGIVVSPDGTVTLQPVQHTPFAVSGTAAAAIHAAAQAREDAGDAADGTVAEMAGMRAIQNAHGPADAVPNVATSTVAGAPAEDSAVIQQLRAEATASAALRARVEATAAAAQLEAQRDSRASALANALRDVTLDGNHEAADAMGAGAAAAALAVRNRELELELARLKDETVATRTANEALTARNRELELELLRLVNQTQAANAQVAATALAARNRELQLELEVARRTYEATTARAAAESAQRAVHVERERAEEARAQRDSEVARRIEAERLAREPARNTTGALPVPAPQPPRAPTAIPPQPMYRSSYMDGASGSSYASDDSVDGESRLCGARTKKGTPCKFPRNQCPWH